MSGQTFSLRDSRHIDKTFYMGFDDRFYELNHEHYKPSDELTKLVRPLIADLMPSWGIHQTSVWTHVGPTKSNPIHSLPAQGWKIHVSATNENCFEILVKVATFVLRNQIQFKFANDTEVLRMMTSKRWPRGGSGKFITIYPRSNERFHYILENLYALLEGLSGPYILSDRRYKDSKCLYYRYGSIIANSERDFMGFDQQFLTSPDGDKVKDDRNPYFELPDWVEDPYPETEEPDGDDLTLNDGRYVVKEALTFSNTGGVYLAHDIVNDIDVVIKEARPHVEMSKTGTDAVKRLISEEVILRFLKDTNVVPHVYSSFYEWENYYIVEEYLGKTNLREFMLSDTPLLNVEPTVESSELFYKKYVKIFKNLLQSVDKIHQSGVVIGDMSPLNIMVDGDTMGVRVIDLEGSFRPSFGESQDLHTAGFRHKQKNRKTGSDFGDDMYAVGAIMFYSMFPLAAMSFIREDMYENVLPIVVADLGWSDTPILNVIQGLIFNEIDCQRAIELLDGSWSISRPFSPPNCSNPNGVPTKSLPEIIKSLSQFVTSNYRLAAPYALFPVDPFASHTNDLGFGFGSSGIIYALGRSGFEVPFDAMQRYNREIEAIKQSDLSPGLLVGAAGIAWALLCNGDEDGARRFMDYANADPLLKYHHSLYYGMAGIGMANIAFFMKSKERHYLDVALDLGETLKARALESERGVYWSDDEGVRIGYGYGQSGVALFLLRLSQVVDDQSWKEFGLRALQYDLSFGHEIEPGVTSFSCSPDEVTTYEPYIEEGTGGIAKVAMRYGLVDSVEGLLRDTYRKYSTLSGLIYGLTGFVDVLTDAYIYSGEERYLEMAKRPLQGMMEFFIFDTKDGYAVPGDNLFRISCDYATGVAGVMSTLHRHCNLSPDDFCLDELDRVGEESLCVI